MGLLDGKSLVAGLGSLVYLVAMKHFTDMTVHPCLWNLGQLNRVRPHSTFAFFLPLIPASTLVVGLADIDKLGLEGSTSNKEPINIVCLGYFVSPNPCDYTYKVRHSSFR